MKKLLFIGPICKGEIPRGGDTMKNQLFIKRFSEVFDKIVAIDTLTWRKNPLVILKILICLILFRNAKVVLSCEKVAPIIIKFLYYVRIQKQVFYWMVGSDVAHRLIAGELKTYYFGYLKQIIVQSPQIVDNLSKLGLANVIYIPNSKPMFDIPAVDHSKGLTKFVYLSRILPEKGCDLLVNIIKRLNQEGREKNFDVTFYGPIMEGYDFLSKIEDIKNVKYKGVLDLQKKEGYEELSKYDVFLFPTFYKGEGFPGSVIDTFIAGLPIIATDWHYNKEVVRDGETGVIIPPNDEEALYNSMLQFVNDKSGINAMGENCKREAKKYDINIILNNNKLHQIGLLDNE